MQNAFRSFFKSSAIVDFGSGQTKTDDSREELPQFIFKSIVGRPKYSRLIGDVAENWVISPEIERLGLFKLSHSIHRGIFQSEEDMRAIMSKVYSDLGYNNNKRPMLYTEPIFTAKTQKKRILKMGFDTLETESILFANQCSLALIAYGKTDGLVLESGEGLTQIATIYGGYKIESACSKYEFGGYDVSQYLKKLLTKHEVSLHPTSEWHILNEIKTTIGKVAQNEGDLEKYYQQDKNSRKVTEYHLPDGEVLKLTDRELLCGEVLFQPQIGNYHHPSIPEMILKTTESLEPELQATMIKNIYLSGGNTKITGFDTRLSAELNKGINPSHKRKLCVPKEDRSLIVWQGGAVLTNLTSINKMWITSKEYDEQGDRIFLIKSI